MMRLATFTVGVLALASGCGTSEFELAPVSGTVTLDGEPVAAARVIFEPQRDGQEAFSAGPGSDGMTDEAGRYSLRTSVSGDAGAVIGQHRVTISTYLSEVDRTRDMGRVVRAEEIPPRYFTPGALSFEVPAEGTDNADFALEKN
jgi:hypothetical protein